MKKFLLALFISLFFSIAHCYYGYITTLDVSNKHNLASILNEMNTKIIDLEYRLISLEGNNAK